MQLEQHYVSVGPGPSLCPECRLYDVIAARVKKVVYIPFAPDIYMGAPLDLVMQAVARACASVGQLVRRAGGGEGVREKELVLQL
jgi:hypothetical protein